MCERTGEDKGWEKRSERGMKKVREGWFYPLVRGVDKQWTRCGVVLGRFWVNVRGVMCWMRGMYVTCDDGKFFNGGACPP